METHLASADQSLAYLAASGQPRRPPHDLIRHRRTHQPTHSQFLSETSTHDASALAPNRLAKPPCVQGVSGSRNVLELVPGPHAHQRALFDFSFCLASPRHPIVDPPAARWR
ncbi:hypothetical protein FS749_002024 [Ceratobasidium sp. UAMH 11750]|nr:hypothetical protein FS749_002024 [Ceratobasidium sp. UAMH 11750]